MSETTFMKIIKYLTTMNQSVGRDPFSSGFSIDSPLGSENNKIVIKKQTINEIGPSEL